MAATFRPPHSPADPAGATPAFLRVWSSPLARGSDRAESVLMVVVVLLWALAAPLIATAASVLWPAVSARVDAAGRAAVAVDAMVVPGAAAPATPLSLPRDRAGLLRWTDATGATVVRAAVLPVGSVAGQHRTVWVGPDGQIVAEPLSPAAAGAAVVAGAVLAWALTGGVLLGLSTLVRRRLDATRGRGWDHEWAVLDGGGPAASP